MRLSDNYRDVIMSIFKYLSMMRASALPAWHQREISEIKAMRFRFQEKRAPDDYATFMSEHMAWPVPRDQIITAPTLVEEWDEADPVNGGEREVRGLLDSLCADNGRAILMAQKDEHERLNTAIEWVQEPWYGTRHTVERFDEKFIAEVSFLRCL